MDKMSTKHYSAILTGANQSPTIWLYKTNFSSLIKARPYFANLSHKANDSQPASFTTHVTSFILHITALSFVILHERLKPTTLMHHTSRLTTTIPHPSWVKIHTLILRTSCWSHHSPNRYNWYLHIGHTVSILIPQPPFTTPIPHVSVHLSSYSYNITTLMLTRTVSTHTSNPS